MAYEALKCGDIVRMFDQREPLGMICRIEPVTRYQRQGDDAIFVNDAQGRLHYCSRWTLKRYPENRLPPNYRRRMAQPMHVTRYHGSTYSGTR